VYKVDNDMVDKVNNDEGAEDDEDDEIDGDGNGDDDDAITVTMM
jgi:hypothetical protein